MRRAAIILTLTVSLAHGEEGSAMERTLKISRPLASGAVAFLEVQVGPLTPGQQIRVTTPSGTPLGMIVPFGPAARASGGVYPIPVPADAIRDQSLSVRLSVDDGNKPSRAPTVSEVPGIRLLAPDGSQ